MYVTKTVLLFSRKKSFDPSSSALILCKKEFIMHPVHKLLWRENKRKQTVFAKAEVSEKFLIFVDVGEKIKSCIIMRRVSKVVKKDFPVMHKLDCYKK